MFTRNRSTDTLLLSPDMYLLCVCLCGAKTHMDGLFQEETCRGERNVAFGTNTTVCPEYARHLTLQ
jgi:hypothetical protein